MGLGVGGSLVGQAGSELWVAGMPGDLLVVSCYLVVVSHCQLLSGNGCGHQEGYGTADNGDHYSSVCAPQVSA